MSLSPLRLGYVPLTDAAPLIVAAELGFAAEEGLVLDLVRLQSWAQCRDMLGMGGIDAAHMLVPLPIAQALGLGPAYPRFDLVMVLSVGGQAVAVSAALAEAMRAAGHGFGFGDPIAARRALAAAVPGALRVGVPFPFSTQAELVRRWLAALVDQAQRNLAALEAGQSVSETLAEVLARMPKGENVRTRNIYWTAALPPEERDIYDDRGHPKLALIARIERQWLGDLAGKIAGWRKAGADRLPGGDERAGLAARLSDLLPSRSDSKPSKAWLERARAALDPGTLDQILRILGSHTPHGSHREEHEALVLMGRAKPPEFRQEQMIAMVWAAHLAPAARAAPVLEGAAQRCYAKLPHHGAANLRLGNAAATALSLLPDGEGLSALARLRDLA